MEESLRLELEAAWTQVAPPLALLTEELDLWASWSVAREEWLVVAGELQQEEGWCPRLPLPLPANALSRAPPHESQPAQAS